MREHDDPGARREQLLERRHRALDAARVADQAVLHRHVEVEPDQHRPARDVAQILQRAQVGHRRALPPQSLPRIAATSPMRQEKPHSLSYQDATRTSLPSSTLVAERSTVELWLSWLKSTETRGSVW